MGAFADESLDLYGSSQTTDPFTGCWMTTDLLRAVIYGRLTAAQSLFMFAIAMERARYEVISDDFSDFKSYF